MNFEEATPGSRDQRIARLTVPSSQPAAAANVPLEQLSGEHWYREMFLRSPMAMLEEDWSGAKRAVDTLLKSGVADFDQYVAEHPDFVYEVRKSHRVVDANPAALELLGFESREEFLGKSSELLPANVESNVQVLRAFAMDMPMAEGERMLRSPSGHYTPILWRVSIPPPDSDFRRLVFYAVDVSRLKRAEYAVSTAQAELARVTRTAMLGEMVASIAHEINQPLGAIKLFIDTAQRWLDRDPPNVYRAKVSIRSAHSSAERVANIVARVRNLVRRVPQVTRKLAVKRVVSESIALVEQEAQAHRIEIEFRPPSDLPAVRAEGTQIQQVLVNLLNNAIQAITASGVGNGRIRISARQIDPNRICVDVEDNGGGFLPGQEEVVFRPFFSTKPDGMGLGLSICRTIMESQGGDISARRLPEGGASFTFSLPVFQ